MHAGNTSSSHARVIGARPKWPRSAYSASAPVIASTTAASEKNAIEKWPDRKPRAYVGESAFRIAGCWAMPDTPHAPIARNHTIITGPNMRPTAAVPIRCVANRRTMITAVIGTTRCARDGCTTLSPSTADSTEIAGVIMLSPKNSEAPKIPSAASTSFVRRPPCVRRRPTRVISAMMPPSPSLSARITSST